MTASTTEVARPKLTRSRVTEMLDEIDRISARGTDLVIELWSGRAWEALDYPSWDEFASAVLADRQVKLPKVDRIRKVIDMRVAGMPSRAIGAVLGVHQSTVLSDLDEAVSVDGFPSTDLPDTVISSAGVERKARTRDIIDTPTPEPTIPEKPVDPFAGWSTDELRMYRDLMSGHTVVASMRKDEHENLVRWADEKAKTVRIDRKTRWGNPFEIPDDGDRAAVIAKYADHYLPHKPLLMADLVSLRGKVLLCWCAPLPCHGDVLRERAERADRSI